MRTRSWPPRLRACWLGTLALVLAVQAGAEGPASDEGPEMAENRQASDAGAPAAEAPVAIDRLLRLPESYSTDGARRGGASQNQWRKRFDEAREQLETSRAELDRMQQRLESLAVDSSQWQAGAPGVTSSDPTQQTLNYKLRQDLRAQRDAVERAERTLLDLQVQADLAGVPPAWRQ